MSVTAGSKSPRDLFLAALKLVPEQRQAYLDEACGGDESLQTRVQDLLDAHQLAESFLEPIVQREQTAHIGPVTERPGTIIGPYKLLEQIGEGGMGVVFMAEQLQPIQRKVALKVVKPGMDSKQVLARFDAERHALALMDHPNIAKVLDAGTTESGRPYFVMELVRGVPLTDFSDQHKLTIRERLGLLASVCQAVQHAHQKGIIHRDLKPGNVLVTMHDGQPVVKVIDFGVAKATGQKLTEKTLFTGLLQMIGTPLYMSPEQAELSNLDVDTRSDIYSLGVMLYELLTGTTPFDSQRLKAAAFDEIRRIIREEEPPRPSTRLSTLAQQDSSTISEKRAIDPRQLSKLFQGELDWIVMKCLEKDRNRRFETASALGADLEHYLHDEPVEACPPSKIYRLRKFARHYRVALITASLVVAALIVGLAGTTWQAVRATHAEQQTKASEQLALKNSRRADAISDFLINALRSPDPARDGRSVTIAEVLDRTAKEVEEEFADDKRMQADLLNAIAKSYEGLGLYRESVLLFGKVQELRSAGQGPRDPGTIEAMGNYASAYESAGQFDKAIPLYQEVLRIQKERLASDDPELLATTTKLAWAFNMSGQTEKALALFQEVLRLVQAKVKTSDPVPFELPNVDENSENGGTSKKPVMPLVENTFEHLDDTGPNQKNVLVALNNLAKAFAEAGQVDQAIPLYQQTLKLMQEKLGPDDPMTLTCMYNLAMAFKVARRFDEAIPLFDETLRLRKEKFGPESDIVARTMTCAGVTYGAAGQKDKCVELFGESLRITKAHFGDDHPDTLWSMWQYGLTLCDGGREKEALPIWEKALPLARVNPGVDHPTTLGLMRNLAEIYRENSRYEDRIPLFEEMLKVRQTKLGASHPATLWSMNELAYAYLYVDRSDDTVRLIEEALALLKSAPSLNPHEQVRIIGQLASTSYFAGRLNDYFSLRKDQYQISRAELGPNDPDTLQAMLYLGSAYLDSGRYDESVRILEEALKLATASLGVNHPDTTELMRLLGVAYSLVGRLDEAVKLHEDALRIQTLIFGPYHPRTVGTSNFLASTMALQGRYAEAEASLRADLPIIRTKLPADYSHIADCLYRLAHTLWLQGRFGECEPLAREAMEISEKRPLQPNDWRINTARGLLGAALLGQKQYAQAESNLVPAYEGLRDHEATVPAGQKLHVKEVLQCLVDLYLATKQPEKAASYRTQLADYERAHNLNRTGHVN